jgi:hypothetical protein
MSTWAVIKPRSRYFGRTTSTCMSPKPDRDSVGHYLQSTAAFAFWQPFSSSITSTLSPAYVLVA